MGSHSAAAIGLTLPGTPRNGINSILGAATPTTPRQIDLSGSIGHGLHAAQRVPDLNFAGPSEPCISHAGGSLVTGANSNVSSIAPRGRQLNLHLYRGPASAGPSRLAGRCTSHHRASSPPPVRG